MLRVWIFAEAFGCLEFSFSRFTKECKKTYMSVGKVLNIFASLSLSGLCYVPPAGNPSLRLSGACQPWNLRVNSQGMLWWRLVVRMQSLLAWIKAPPAPPPAGSLNGLVDGFCVLFPILCLFHNLSLCFSLVFLWVFPSDLLFFGFFFFFFFLSLLVGRPPNLVPRLGNQGQYCLVGWLAQLCLTGQGLWMWTGRVEGILFPSQDHGSCSRES